jgi:hypothetical protein
MEFGIFDHVDRGGDMPLPDYYEARLRLVELYDRGRFYCYHVADHHSTPLSDRGFGESRATAMTGV